MAAAPSRQDYQSPVCSTALHPEPYTLNPRPRAQSVVWCSADCTFTLRAHSHAQSWVGPGAL